MGLKLGDVSPLAGMMTGEGLTGKLMRQGFGGMIPATIARNMYDDEEEKKRKMAGGTPMKKGGKVKSSSASKRGDGIAKRGKTRGKMV